MTGEITSRGPAGPEGPRGPEGPPGNGGSAHVENATIDVSKATIVQSPQSRRASVALAYAVGVLFIFVIAIGLANLLFTNSQVHSVSNAQATADRNAATLRQQIVADCGEQRDLAGLPVTAVGNGHPSELGVKIVLDARASFYGHDCPGSIPPLSESVRSGAAFYHLPIPQPKPPGGG